jgi:3-hydroxybutyrate dehydrogenase
MNAQADNNVQATWRPLSGKAAIVTGSTSGIGLAIAHSLAAAGANIMLNGFGPPGDIAKIQTAMAQDHGVKVVYSNADMSDAEDIGRMVALAEAELGGTDILVNNAGIQHVAPVAEFPPEKWNAILAINLTSAFHTTRLTLPAMVRKGYGRIINIASAHGLVASPFKSAYVTAKHGLLGFTKTVALEAAESAVTCNAICPGYVATPLVEQQIESQAKAHGISREAVVRDVLLAQQPNKRFVGAAEIGAMVVFLASNQAASITGSAITIDGGWTAH